MTSPKRSRPNTSKVRWLIINFRVNDRPEEAIYILPSSDRVTVIFSTIFKEETDRIFGKVFLQEFVDARRRPSCQTAPQVLYSNREAPLEIRELKELIDGDNIGYVTFGASFLLQLRSHRSLLMLVNPHSSVPKTFLERDDSSSIYHSDPTL
jgi:hypothetical protein